MSLDLKKRIITSIFLFAILFCIFIDRYFLIFSLILISAISLFEFYNINSKIFKDKIFKKYMANIFFFIYIIIFSTLLFFLIINPNTVLVVIITLLICISSDIGGLVFGKLFKGKKLTKISPKKTISGSIGSFIFSFVILYLFSTSDLFIIDSRLIFYTATTSLSCQVGDIFFSYLKRKAKIKDTGKILPGHGGILDRIDGILLGLPLGVLSLYLMSA